MLSSLRYSAVLGLAAIVTAAAACSGTPSVQPDNRAGTMDSNQRAVIGDLYARQGTDFGTLYVDSRARAPLVSNQYVHIDPPPSQRFGVRPNFTSDDDLIDHGGKITKGLSQYNLYVNCASSCWAVPSGFEINLGLSAMIVIVNQYGASGTYDFGGSAQVAYANNHTLYDPDVQTIVSSFINQFHTPTGYAAMYNVFIKQGTDDCDAGKIESANPNVKQSCYSPDKLSTFKYCAYHSSADMSGIGHVLYSVEPFQNITQCKVKGNPPNGFLADSTDSTLSHEIFETITDPDGKAWYNENGDEIGDICRPLDMIVTLRNQQYDIQGEYSNRITNCAW